MAPVRPWPSCRNAAVLKEALGTAACPGGRGWSGTCCCGRLSCSSGAALRSSIDTRLRALCPGCRESSPTARRLAWTLTHSIATLLSFSVLAPLHRRPGGQPTASAGGSRPSTFFDEKRAFPPCRPSSSGGYGRAFPLLQSSLWSCPGQYRVRIGRRLLHRVLSRRSVLPVH